MQLAVLSDLPGILTPSCLVGRVWLTGMAENGPYLPYGGTECDPRHVGSLF